MSHLYEITFNIQIITMIKVKVKVSLCLTNYYAMNMYWGMEV